MAEAFNPYHVWLSIPPEEQPANYYRLLSLPLLESNPDVIDNAADRQTAHLRTFQSGKNGKFAERLLNEVAAARVCLLDPQKKAAYDQRIQAWLAARKAQAADPQQTAPRQQAAAQPSAGDWDNLLGDLAGKQQKSVGSRQGAVGSKQKAKQRPLAIFAVAGVLLVAAAGIGLVALNSKPADGTLALDWPADQREGATLTIDDAPVPFPAAATIERAAPPGEHRLAATRPLYQPWSATVTVAAGERHPVAIEWKPKAVVALDWPVKDRQGAELKIDGKPQPLTDHVPLELLVEPGEHTIRVLRPNAEPVQTGVQVALGGRRTIAIAPAAADTTLLVQWPAADRSGAHLSIDGEDSKPSKSSPDSLELTLKTGRHTVRITRPGFQPIEQSVELAAADNKPLLLTWTPEVAINNQPATPDSVGRSDAPSHVAQTTPPSPESPNTAAETPPAKKRPIPSADEQAKLAKQLDELYKPTRTAADAAKANELYDLADKAQSPAERYMLLAKGAELAAGAGDAALAFSGVDLLAAEYEIEPFEAKQKLLDKAVIAASTAEQTTQLIAAAESLLDGAIAADQYAAAMAIAAAASKALGKRPVDAQLRKDTDDLLARRRRDIRILEPLYAAAQKAQKTLDASPADADAILTVGRWFCLYKNDWPRGLPLLAKGKDEKLKAAALAELKPPATTDEQVQAADAWWDVSQKELGLAHDAIRSHAGDLYTAALPGLNSSIAKIKIDKRLAEIASIHRPLSTRPPSSISVAHKANTRRTTKAAGGALKGTLAVIFKGGTLEVYVNGQKVHSSEGGGLRNIPLALFPGDCLVFRVESKYVYRNMRFAFVDGQGRALFVSNPATTVMRAVADPSAPAPAQMFAADPAKAGRSSKEPGWDDAKLPAEAAWLDVPAKRTTFEFATSVPLLGGGEQPTKIDVVKAFPLGQWVDVLGLVDVARNAVKGDWSRRGVEISCEAGDTSRLELPLKIDGDYDLQVELTRTEGNGDINTFFTVGPHQCMFMLDGYNGSLSALDVVDGHLPDNPLNPTAKHSDALENGRRYQILLSVRRPSADHASVDVSLDGKPFLPHWEGNPASLTPHTGWWAMPHADWLGLGVFKSKVTFHSVRLRMLSGQATPETATAADTGNAPTAGQRPSDAGGLPAEEQVAAVVKKLEQLNPGFDGKETHKIENGVVTAFSIATDNVSDISPLQALVGLKRLTCGGSAWNKQGKVTDLSPLKQMKLEVLNCPHTPISDLSPLAGMPLVYLNCNSTALADLTPLAGMPLSELNLGGTQVADLSPLAGLPLTKLAIDNTPVTDLAPLAGLPLIHLSLERTKVTDLSALQRLNLEHVAFTPARIIKSLDVLRQMKSVTQIGTAWNAELPPDEFWKKYDAGEFK